MAFGATPTYFTQRFYDMPSILREINSDRLQETSYSIFRQRRSRAFSQTANHVEHLVLAPCVPWRKLRALDYTTGRQRLAAESAVEFLGDGIEMALGAATVRAPVAEWNVVNRAEHNHRKSPGQGLRELVVGVCIRATPEHFEQMMASIACRKDALNKLSGRMPIESIARPIPTKMLLFLFSPLLSAYIAPGIAGSDRFESLLETFEDRPREHDWFAKHPMFLPVVGPW